MARQPARSIPACAGEPQRYGNPLPFMTVYPRVCGGTQNRRRKNFALKGLSPRVRGNLSCVPAGLMLTRSIPACAGEPGTAKSSPAFAEVYPRVCGGTAAPDHMDRTGWGLSPRVRGNRPDAPSGRRRKRSIPACAGEPSTPFLCGFTAEVYPRVCGGTTGTPSYRVRGCGLSPRVRGNPRQPLRASWQPGSIPACAGEPVAAGAGYSASAVYPRVCGGTHPAAWHTIRRRGLSPRVRGNRL